MKKMVMQEERYEAPVTEEILVKFEGNILETGGGGGETGGDDGDI